MRNNKSHLGAVLKVAAVSVGIFLLGCIVFLSCCTRYNAKETVCRAYIYQLGFYLDHHYRINNTYPRFYNDEGKNIWSWRAVFLLHGDFSRFSSDIRFNEPWNSPHNLPIVKSLDEKVEQSFACPFLYPKDNRAAFVAVTGEGTAWNEISNGNLTPEECKEMIVLIETQTPKNHWAEPGDDMTPEEVIKMYTDYKAARKNFLPPSRHPAKRFLTVGCKSETFDDINDVEDLKKRLVVESSK